MSIAMLGKIFRRTSTTDQKDLHTVNHSKTNERSKTQATSSNESGEILSPAVTAIKMSQVIHSNHVNKDKILEGGQLLKWVDTCACLSAERLAGHPCVTVSVDDLYFQQEVKLGQVINLSAQVNRSFKTSMEVGVAVTCEDLQEKAVSLVCKAFMTFVALSETGGKVVLPQLTCRTTDEKLAYSLANERRKVRISYASTLKSLLSNYNTNPSSPLSSSPHHSPVTPPDLVNDLIEGETTRVESVELVLPPHANHHGNTFGGQVMAWMENVASISAGHLYHGVVTLRSIDTVFFRAPSTVGDRIVLKSIVNNVFKNSLEVGVRVEAYRYEGGKIGDRRHINSAFFTYDINNSSSVISLPVYLPEPEEGGRRLREATARRKMRLDRRYILSQRYQDALSVPWNKANSLYLCYGNIMTLTELASQPDWQVMSLSNEVTLSTREHNGVLCFRATMKMDSTFRAEYVFSVLRDMCRRVAWDPLMLSCQLVKGLGEEDAIYHTVMKSSSQESNTSNDFILLASDRKASSSNESYRVAIRSVTLREFPPTEEYSRTEVACAGFVIRQKEGKCTEVSYYNETNPQMVSYITYDVAGLSAIHCQVFSSLLDYLTQNASVVSSSPVVTS